MLTEKQLREKSVKELHIIARSWNGNTSNVKRESTLALISNILEEKGSKLPFTLMSSEDISAQKTNTKREFIPSHKIFDSTAYDLILKNEDMDPIVRRELLTANKHTQLFLSATSRGKEFNLTLPDTRKLITTKTCAYTGAKLEDKKGSMNGRTVERIDGSKGYVKGNVIAVTRKANDVKNMLLENDESEFKMTEDEFIQFALNMVSQIKGKK